MKYQTKIEGTIQNATSKLICLRVIKSSRINYTKSERLYSKTLKLSNEKANWTT